VPVHIDLSDILRDDHNAVYTAQQLEPTRARLRSAVDDLGTARPGAAALVVAWTRIAELRLPRKAVPGAVLDQIEALVAVWGSHATGGIAQHAYALSEDERAVEAARIRGMLSATEAAAANAPSERLFLSE